MTNGPNLAVVLGAARSGTTLLRRLLDAHPQVGCPAEAGLPNYISHSRMVWGTICTSRTNSIDNQAPTRPATESLNMIDGLPVRHHVARDLPNYVEAEIVRNAQRMMRYYCTRDTATYCDKTLDNVQHVAAVHRSFPTAKYVIVVRHVMDTIMSGLEASPWGFEAFGYATFVRESPDNTVVALARYWEMQVSLALRWLEQKPGQCHVVRYEDLVRETSGVMESLFEFLGVTREVDVARCAFGSARGKDGPGDYKVLYTDTVESQSIGRGRRVPVDRLPPPVLERLNELLAKLGYPQVGENWNIQPRSDGPVSAVLRADLRSLMEGLPVDPSLGVGTIAIVADDDIDLRWVLDTRDGSVRDGDGDVDVVIAGAASDLLRMLKREENAGALMRSGLVRAVPANSELKSMLDLPTLVKRLIRG